jgi:hypothetical protein
LVPESAFIAKSQKDIKTVEMLKAWVWNRSLFRLTETFKYPRQESTGVDWVRLYTFAGK